nr:hypothetical protein [Tanacetum cinerariifolium]
MILESVEHGPLIWPTVEENGVSRTNKYAKLSAAKKIQADCDMKATNIILQGLPADIYSLVNHHRVAKDLWERERGCKLYDAFDKLTHIKGESLHTYYLRFTQLINGMNIYNMKMEQFQVNTKFLNSLPPEWSKFVTDVMLVKNLHTSNYDQLHSYLEQHELHANEVHLMRDDLIACLNRAMAFLTVAASPRFPSNNNKLKTSSNTRNQATSQDGRVTVQQVQGRQGKNYSGTTYKGNATRLRGNTTSGHARVVKCYNFHGKGHMARQCTQPKRQRNDAWYKEKAMLAEAQEAGQILDEEQLAFLADPRISAGQVQTIIPHNVAFQTEDLDTYDSDCDDLSNAQAVLMANISNYGSDVISDVPNSDNYLNDMDNQKAQEAGKILDEEQLAFLADPRISAGQVQTIIPHNVAFQTEDLDTYDSDCDDLSNAQAVLMANISNYGSDVISDVPNSDNYLNDMDNQSVHALQDFKQSQVMDFTNNEISSDSNIIPYSQYFQETQQEKANKE